MLILFAAAICVSAALLFLVEPLFASLMLPLLGGSSSVWNTATMFYQLVLLAGYVYAHFTRNKLSPKAQVIVHGAVCLVPLALLPIAIPAGWVPPTTTNPVPWVLLLMTVAVGLPFFAVATTSPLVQSWFSRTSHTSAKDPYFLYAASNIGSLLGLLVYPFVLQPALQLNQISTLWSFGYGAFIVLIGACAVTLLRRPPTTVTAQVQPQAQTAEVEQPITLGRRVRWVLLAFVPSSLMLSVTTYISTDIGAMPMLWVVPLALYLLTFILAFSKRQIVPYSVLSLVMKACLVPMLVIMAGPMREPLLLVLSAHLFMFFLVALACHTTLAKDRPSARHLTEFYLFMSLGGALGGTFNGLVAPLIFNSVTEYPLVLGLSALLLWRPSASFRFRVPDIALPALIGGLAALGLVLAPTSLMGTLMSQFKLVQLIVLGGCAALAMIFLFNNLRYGLAIGLLFIASAALYTGDSANRLLSRRSFFGVSRVTYAADIGFRRIEHGNTIHGMQSIDPARECEPTGYYTRNSPIGQTLGALEGERPSVNVAIVGLGAGGLATYARPADAWTYYEIDPVVEEIARDTKYFTFLSKCGPQARVVLGDGRLSLGQAANGSYDLLVLDAYSSDALPMHLLTREAVSLYAQKISPKGLLAFHISNRYFDLRPALGNIAHDLGLTALVQSDLKQYPDDRLFDRSPSTWVLMARDPTALKSFVQDTRWQAVAFRPDKPIWTDSYSSILTALK